MAANERETVIVIPHKEIGMIRTHIFEDEAARDAQLRLHQKQIKALAVNPDCTLIASASTNGTVIKITSVESGEVLQELR